MPLAEGQNLRFWVSDYEKRDVLQALADAGYGEPIFRGMSPQVDVKSYSMGLVNNFELALPAERQPVQDDRTIRGDVVDREKQAAEKAAVEAMYKAIYHGKRQ